MKYKYSAKLALNGFNFFSLSLTHGYFLLDLVTQIKMKFQTQPNFFSVSDSVSVQCIAHTCSLAHLPSQRTVDIKPQ